MSTIFRPRLRDSGADESRPSGLRLILTENLRLLARSWVRLVTWLRARTADVEQRTAPARARVRQWLSPVISTVTGLGWGVVVVSVLSLVLGFVLGWAELAAIAVVLLVSLAIGVLSILGRLRYEVTVSLASARVVVGERAVGQLHVRNAAARSAAPSVIELPVGKAVASLPIPRLDPDASHEELFTIPTQRRAVLQLGPVRSVRQDPLQLLRRQLLWTEPEDIYIHPKTVRLDNSSTGFVRDLEGLATKDLSNDDVSFHALREYQPGDDLRYVHWRSTARTGQLMIRQFEETRRSQFVIIVATRGEDYRDDDEFELGISIAASLARSAQLDGKEVSVFTSDERLATLTPDRLMDGFSALLPSRSRERYPDRVRSISADNPGASVVALVTGSVPPISEVHLASLRTPLMARCYAVRAASGEELGRRTLGDLGILTVATLDDLPAAMRAVS